MFLPQDNRDSWMLLTILVIGRKWLVWSESTLLLKARMELFSRIHCKLGERRFFAMFVQMPIRIDIMQFGQML